MNFASSVRYINKAYMGRSNKITLKQKIDAGEICLVPTTDVQPYSIVTIHPDRGGGMAWNIHDDDDTLAYNSMDPFLVLGFFRKKGIKPWYPSPGVIVLFLGNSAIWYISKVKLKNCTVLTVLR